MKVEVRELKWKKGFLSFLFLISNFTFLL